MPRRSLAVGIGIIAVCGAIFTLQFTASVLIPIVVSVLLFYALDPLVRPLVRWSPKSQAQWVGAPVDRSVKPTSSGAAPDVAEAVKDAVGGFTASRPIENATSSSTPS